MPTADIIFISNRTVSHLTLILFFPLYPAVTAVLISLLNASLSLLEILLQRGYIPWGAFSSFSNNSQTKI